MRTHVSGVHDAHRPAGGRRAAALLWRSVVGCIVTLALGLTIPPTLLFQADEVIQ